jgi:hypothetical protein
MATPETNARNIAAALIREARTAGWARVQAKISTDYSVTIDASMVDPDDADDFLGDDLRMSK